MRKTECKIIFGLYDLTARSDANYKTFPLQAFSDTNNFAQNTAKGLKLATLEDNQILTDGSFIPFQKHDSFGLWSKEMSGSDGLFTSPVILTVEFANLTHSSMGISLHFDAALEDWAGETEIRWYDENNILIDFKSYIPDRPVYFYGNGVKDYKRIEFIFYGTSKPYRYLKINGIDFGIVATKNKDEIVSARITENARCISDQLIINTLISEFSFEDADFSMLSSQGIYEYLKERQKLEVFMIKDGEEIPVGVFYVDSWDSGTAKSVKLTAVDAVGVIDKIPFKGGMYDDVPAELIIAEIMSGTELEYSLHPALGTRLVKGHIPSCSRREALQSVCMAIGGVVNTTRDGIVKIAPPAEETELYIPCGRKIIGQTPKVKPLTTGIEVTAHNYVKNPEIKEVLKQNYDVGEHTLKFDKPMHSVTVTGAAVKSLNVNEVIFVVSSDIYVSSEVTIYGGVYDDLQEVVYMELAKIPGNTKPEIIRIENCTLISRKNAKEVARRALDYYKERHQINTKIIVEYEEAGKLAVVESMEESALRGYVESMNIDLTGGYLADIVVSGTPIAPFNGYYTTEIYTGEDVGII